MTRRRPAQFTHPAGYFDLLHDLERPGCAACRGANRSAWRYLDSLLWEFVTDPGVRWHLRASHGFCREHGHMAAAVAADQSGQLGMAILVEDFLSHVLGHVAEAMPEPDARSRKRLRRNGARPEASLEPETTCPACEAAWRVAALYLGLLASETGDTEIGTAAISALLSLCLPHLKAGLRLRTDQVERARLLEIYTAGAEQVRRDVREFIRKRDWQHHDESTTQEESRAWNAGIRLLVGESWRRPSPR